MKQQKQKKVLLGFVIFLILMWICTLVSKSIYASKLPQVSCSTIENKKIEHIVEVDGMLTQGSESAIHSMAGLRVEKILTRIGDKVEEGDILFQLDMDYLKETIDEKKWEITKLEYAIKDLKNNAAFSEQDNQKQMEHAEQDYITQEYEADYILKRKREALKQAEDALKKHKDNGITVSGNDAESAKESLEKAVQNAKNDLEDAIIQQNNLLVDGNRNIDNSLSPKQSDSTVEVNQLLLQRLRKELKKYNDIYENNGEIKSEVAGTILNINLSVGAQTPEGAAIVCVDETVPFQFETIFTKEQKKYINLGDTISLKTSTLGTKEYNLDYLMEEENSPGSYRGIVYLPQGVGSLGMSATLTKSEGTESFPCCIPIQALYSDNNGTLHFVYVIGEREGILGKELYVERRNVRVLDYNDRYAALEEGTIGKNDRIIMSGDREYSEGDIIRIKS